MQALNELKDASDLIWIPHDCIEWLFCPRPGCGALHTPQHRVGYGLSNDTIVCCSTRHHTHTHLPTYDINAITTDNYNTECFTKDWNYASAWYRQFEWRKSLPKWQELLQDAMVPDHFRKLCGAGHAVRGLVVCTVVHGTVQQRSTSAHKPSLCLSVSPQAAALDVASRSKLRASRIQEARWYRVPAYVLSHSFQNRHNDNLLAMQACRQADAELYRVCFGDVPSRHVAPAAPAAAAAAPAGAAAGGGAGGGAGASAGASTPPHAGGGGGVAAAAAAGGSASGGAATTATSFVAATVVTGPACFNTALVERVRVLCNPARFPDEDLVEVDRVASRISPEKALELAQVYDATLAVAALPAPAGGTASGAAGVVSAWVAIHCWLC